MVYACAPVPLVQGEVSPRDRHPGHDRGAEEGAREKGVVPRRIGEHARRALEMSRAAVEELEGTLLSQGPS